MKKKGMILIGAIVILCVAIWGFWNFKTSKEIEPEYVFLYAENQTDDYPTTLGAGRFAELVEEKTNGRIKILVKAKAELGNESEVLKQLQFGGIAFARVSISQMTEIVPELNVLQLPYLYTDSKHMWRVLDGEIGESFLELVSEGYLVGLSWYDAGARNFYGREPVRCLEDMEDLTIRVQESDMMADMVSALNAKAVKIPYADVYSNLEQGLVDGAENNWPSYEAMKHYEVAPYFTIDEHTRVPEMQICSKKIWEMLSEEDQSILKECAIKSAKYEKWLWRKREEESRKIALEKGVQVIEISEEEKERFQNAMNGIYEKYCADQMELVQKIMEE